MENQEKKKKSEIQKQHEGNHDKYLNFFTSEPNMTLNNGLAENILNEKADHCYPLPLTDKNKCKDCQSPCSYSIQDILSPKCPLSLTDI